MINDLQDDEQYESHPIGGLPSDAVFVVRTSALKDLAALTSEPKPTTERPIELREKTTLLVIIAALAKLAGIDVTRPSKAAMEIERHINLLGARVAARTVENHLPAINGEAAAGDHLGNVARRHRPVELARVAGLADGDEALAAKPRGNALGFLAKLEIARLELAAVLLEAREILGLSPKELN